MFVSISLFSTQILTEGYLYYFRFIRPIKIDESLLIEANALKVGKSIAFLEVYIKNQTSEKLLATGHHIKHL